MIDVCGCLSDGRGCVLGEGGGVTGTWVQLHGSVNGKRAGTRAAFNSTLDLKINKPETRMIAMCFVYVICLYGYVFGS